MRTTILSSISLIILAFTACNPTVKQEEKTPLLPLPAGWHVAGSNPGSYDMGLDEKGGIDKGKCATIQSKDSTINGFGTLMQSVSADSFKGKMVRMSGYIKSADVKEWAGFWMRIDLKNQEMGDFDNMENRSVKGSTDWKKYEIVLHVDTGAVNIAYGALLSSTGKIWFDKMNIEIVPDSTPSTNMITDNKAPSNLDFEK